MSDIDLDELRSELDDFAGPECPHPATSVTTTAPAITSTTTRLIITRLLTKRPCACIWGVSLPGHHHAVWPPAAPSRAGLWSRQLCPGLLAPVRRARHLIAYSVAVLHTDARGER